MTDADTNAAQERNALDRRLLALDPSDNVLVARERLAAGDEITLEAGPVTADTAVDVGFKIARHDIETGAVILKYGAPIGSATRAIKAGALVHVHNMKSDYIPTYSQDDGARFTKRRST